MEQDKTPARSAAHSVPGAADSPIAPGRQMPPAPAAPPPFHRERRSRHMGWRSQDVIRAAALVIAMYLATRLLWFAYPLVFATFLGVLFGLAVSGGVDKLARWRIPRGVA